MYISHIRSEGNRLLEGVDELIKIANDSDARSEIYHLKAAGQANWIKHEAVVNRIETARSQGLEITADIYNYTACCHGARALHAAGVQEGGYRALGLIGLAQPQTTRKSRRRNAAPSNRVGESAPRRRQARRRSSSRRP